MADMDEVIAIVEALPGVSSGLKWGTTHWAVGKHGFVWERPFSKADVKRFGTAPVPTGPILGLRTEDLHDKAALLAQGRPGVFTIEHFNNYPAVLLQVDVISVQDLRELITEAWANAAPLEVVEAYLGRPGTT